MTSIAVTRFRIIMLTWETLVTLQNHSSFLHTWNRVGIPVFTLMMFIGFLQTIRVCLQQHDRTQNLATCLGVNQNNTSTQLLHKTIKVISILRFSLDWLMRLAHTRIKTPTTVTSV